MTLPLIDTKRGKVTVSFERLKHLADTGKIPAHKRCVSLDGGDTWLTISEALQLAPAAASEGEQAASVPFESMLAESPKESGRHVIPIVATVLAIAAVVVVVATYFCYVKPESEKRIAQTLQAQGAAALMRTEAVVWSLEGETLRDAMRILSLPEAHKLVQGKTGQEVDWQLELRLRELLRLKRAGPLTGRASEFLAELNSKSRTAINDSASLRNIKAEDWVIEWMAFEGALDIGLTTELWQERDQLQGEAREVAKTFFAKTHTPPNAQLPVEVLVLKPDRIVVALFGATVEERFLPEHVFMPTPTQVQFAWSSNYEYLRAVKGGSEPKIETVQFADIEPDGLKVDYTECIGEYDTGGYPQLWATQMAFGSLPTPETKPVAVAVAAAKETPKKATSPTAVAPPKELPAVPAATEVAVATTPPDQHTLPQGAGTSRPVSESEMAAMREVLREAKALLEKKQESSPAPSPEDAAPEPAGALPARNGPLSSEAIFAKVSPAVVRIQTFDERGAKLAQGSGFCATSDGLIVTNSHVVEGAKSASISTSSGGSFIVDSLLVRDEKVDVAVLRVAGARLPHLELAPLGDEPVIGSHVYAIGNPYGYTNTISEGLVNGRRQLDGIWWLQTSAPISPGSSGGPLTDAQGRVIGITTWARRDSQNLNFAVPGDTIRAMLSRAETAAPVKLARFKAKPTQETESADLERAHAAMKAKRWSEALAILARLKNANPLNPVVWCDLGWLHLNTKRSRNAVDEFRSAIQLVPDYASAWVGLGIAYKDVGRFADSLEALGTAYRLRPGDSDTLFFIGECYLAMGNLREASRIADLLTPLDPVGAKAIRDGVGAAFARASAVTSPNPTPFRIVHGD